MKYIFLSMVLFLTVAATACGIHQFKVPLNQRGFYNPATLCPYCTGSMYFATGAYAGVRSDDLGMFVTLGNDGDNSIHGAWDFTYSYASTENTSVGAYSTRYAWKQPIGEWALGIGGRASYTNYSMLMFTSENTISAAQRNCFSFDGGLYVTNQGGFYAGVSVLNLHQPQLAMKFKSPQGEQTYYLQTKRSYVAAAGGVIPLGLKYDVMLDAAGSFSDEVNCVRPSFMFRYKHHYGIGGGVTVSEGQSPVYELQGGFTSTPLKWLFGVAFTSEGPVVETGIVMRFGVEKWRVTKFNQRCVSVPVKTPKRTEFHKED